MAEETSPTALLDGSVDLLISEVDVKEKQLIKDYLLTIHRGIYAAPKYIKKNGAPKNSADLKNHNHFLGILQRWDGFLALVCHCWLAKMPG